MKDYYLEAGNIHLSYFLEAADILGIKYEIVVNKLMAEFKYDNKHWFIINTVLPVNGTPGTTIAKRKHLTNLVLNRAGIKVPVQIGLNNPDDALKMFQKYKDIVIKPTRGYGGHGVSVLPSTNTQVINAFEFAKKNNKFKGGAPVLGEIFVKGDNYRFLVIGENVVGIAKRKPAVIFGNGTNTIQELINYLNVKRETNRLLPIPIDAESIQKLQNQGFTLDSVPQEGKEVYLRFNSNLTMGGTTEECSEIAHQYYKDLAIKAVDAIGLKYGGVDFIVDDITKPGNYIINEINHNPGLRIHYKPDKGNAVKVAVPIMEYIRDNI